MQSTVATAYGVLTKIFFFLVDSMVCKGLVNNKDMAWCVVYMGAVNTMAYVGCSVHGYSQHHGMCWCVVYMGTVNTTWHVLICVVYMGIVNNYMACVDV